MGTPSCFDIWSKITRAMMSTALPAPIGLIARIVCVGQFWGDVWAYAWGGMTANAAPVSAPPSTRMMPI